MVVIIVMGLLVYVFGWQEKGVQLVGSIEEMTFSGLQFYFPRGVWGREDISQLVTGAGALALISSLEAVSVAKAIALHTRQKIDVNREFIGQGLASIASGLTHVFRLLVHFLVAL